MSTRQGDIVLVVDDVPRSIGALCIELEAEGYTVLVASDGESALARLDLVTPDAILMDALMPGVDGFETCRRVKAHPEWQHIPVIFMTGLSETGHIVRGFEAGGVDYVVKPVRMPEVLARLATHVRNSRAVRLARDAIDVGGHGVADAARDGGAVLDSQGQDQPRCRRDPGNEPAHCQQASGTRVREARRGDPRRRRRIGKPRPLLTVR